MPRYLSKEDALELIRGGKANAWNDYRESNPEWIPDLSSVHVGCENIARFDFSKANLRGADLSGAILNAGFNKVDLTAAEFDADTRFPAGFVPEDQGATRVRRERLSLFVSHSSRDLPVVAALVALLRTALNLAATDIRCTSVDGYRLPGGADTDEQLRQEVHDAISFIGVMSPASLDSMYVSFELGARWGAGKPLIPVLVHGADNSYLAGPLAGINTLRLDSESQVLQLVDDLGKQLGIEPESPSVFQSEIRALLECGLPG